jgi:hypothetical protein
MKIAVVGRISVLLLITNITFSSMPASIKNTLIVPGESIGDFKLGMKFGEATKEMNDEAFYTSMMGCSHFHFMINKIADDVSSEARKSIAGKFFNIDSADFKLFNLKYPEFEKAIHNNEDFKNSTVIISIPMGDYPRNFDFFKKNYIIEEIRTYNPMFHTQDGIRVGTTLDEVEKIYGKFTVRRDLYETSNFMEYIEINGLLMNVRVDFNLAEAKLAEAKLVEASKMTEEMTEEMGREMRSKMRDEMTNCGIDYQEFSGPYKSKYESTTKYKKYCIVESFAVRCDRYKPSPLCPDGYRDINDIVLGSVRHYHLLNKHIKNSK